MVISQRFMRKVIIAHILIFLFSGVFESVFKNPLIVGRICEYLAVFEFLFAVKFLYRISKKTRANYLLLIFIGLIVLSIFSFVYNDYSIYTYINGFRNAFKYFMFFFSCIVILEYEDIDKIFNILYVLLLLNVVVCSIQFFKLGYKGDYCCGVFGVSNVNSYINVLIVVMSAYGIAAYLHKQKSLKIMVIIELSCMYIATLAELKFFFFEFMLIMAVSILFFRPNKRTIFIIVGGSLLIVLLPILINQFWGEASSQFFSIEGMKKYLDNTDYGYSTTRDIGRINGISKLNERFFLNSFNLVGYGLGSCDYGTEFMNIHESLHYVWFTYLLTYLELGWLGIIIYVAFFACAAVMCICLKNKMAKDNHSTMVYSIALCMAIMSIILLVYNTTMRNLPAYLMFAVISFIMLVNKKVESN